MIISHYANVVYLGKVDVGNSSWMGALSTPYFPLAFSIACRCSIPSLFLSSIYFHEKIDFLIFGCHCSRWEELHQCHASGGDRDPVNCDNVATKFCLLWCVLEELLLVLCIAVDSFLPAKIYWPFYLCF